MVIRSFVLGTALVATACSGFKDDSEIGDTESASTVAPAYVSGNPDCEDLGYAHTLKIDPPVNGTFTVAFPDGHTVTYTLTDGKTLSWSSQIGLDAVLMKAANGAYVYSYNPEATSDSGLITPNTSSNDPNAPQAGISHIDFCYDLDVVVKKTASTSFTRDTSWTIQKTAAQTNVLLSLGQYYNLAFNVVVSAAGYTDSNWAVGGTITVTNPDPTYKATLSSVTDQLSNFGAIAVDCGAGVTFPLDLVPGASLTCSYASAVPDGSDRTNTGTATAAAGSKVGTGSDTVPVTFSTSGSTVTQVDGCVDVTDTHMGALGTVCASDGSKTFSYTVPLHFDVCGPSTLTNTATYTGNGETGSSTAVVNIDVPCDTGCTLTQGYWKTHSSRGPAPYDDTWGALESTIFFLSGQTYYDVLWTAPAGNQYYVLADQYIAAKLNGINGASVPANVQAAYDGATVLFNKYTPAQVKAMKASNADRQLFTSYAYTLDQYNQGFTGPGHCSE